jgi:hypothetical protein
MRCPRKPGVSSIIELRRKGLFPGYIEQILVLILVNLRGICEQLGYRCAGAGYKSPEAPGQGI